MDGPRFDKLTKTLAQGVSRRQVLKALTGVLAGSVICHDGGALCARDAQCCSGSCGADHRCAGDPACRGEGHPCEGNQTCCAGLVCRASGPGKALRWTTPCTPPPVPPKA